MTQINKIRSERTQVTIDTTEIQKIVRNYYKNLNANKFVSLAKMDNFLETYNLLKLK